MKIIEIESCRGCPYNQWQSHYEEWVCLRDMFTQHTPEEGFPAWCPLPDKEGQDAL